MNGTALHGLMTNFYLQIGTRVYDQNHPNDDFIGFRGWLPEEPRCVACIGGVSPSITVEGGEVTDLIGGVYGVGDGTGVDFFGNNLYVGWSGGSTHIYMTGAISRVPEPSTLYVLGIGLSTALSLSRRMQKR